MPGRLIMDDTVGSKDLKKDRSHSQHGQQSQQPPAVQAAAVPQPNGIEGHVPNGGLPNGVPVTSHPPPTTNGEMVETRTAETSTPTEPPPLDQSWREHPDNKSLGLLMERVAQQCYADLNDTLAAMAEIPVESQQQQANGILPHTSIDTSEGSVQKKRLFMDFANNQRDRFIKTLVLSDWCKKEEEQGRLIDVKVWQDKQRNAHQFAAMAIGNTKNNMIGAKMSNPNIEGAMELQATGKASWVPDLGYIPPKRLSAKQLLETLRNMNVTLAIRLNLHEDLPPHLQDFTIANGRATFTVKDEFEVDLSIADEDPATPFYFIDIRLLFTPSSNVLDDRLRSFMEGKVNQELASKGLEGCYDFLHNFVLTHKINVLRGQATELIRGKWFDCILPESRRRNFFVQYWSAMPGRKSWIEFGIGSGRKRNVHSRHTPTPQISVRWFRRGVEVKDEKLEFDWRDLSLEKCLLTVIAKHTSWLLNDLRERIRNAAPTGSIVTAEVCTDDVSASTPSALSLSLPSMRKPLLVSIEHITGQFSISPPSPATAHTERRLNADASFDAARWLSSLMCAVVQERLRGEATLLGWAPVANLAKVENLQRLFGDGVLHSSVFIPSLAWGDRWALAVTFGLDGEKWWVTSLKEKHDEQSKSVVKVITNARRISLLASAASISGVSYSSLVQIERMAVAEVAFAGLSKELTDMRIQHKFEKLAAPADSETQPGRSTAPRVALWIRFSQLMKTGEKQAWAADPVRLTHHGIVGDIDSFHGSVSSIRHDLRLSLEPAKLKHLQQHLAHFPDQDLAVNSHGGLAISFLTTFGQPFAAQLQKRLQGVDRLDRIVAQAKHYFCKCRHVSLSRFIIIYSEAPELAARITFSNDGGLPVRLKLEPSDRNPHLRIRVMLEDGLNATGDAGSEALICILRTTLPVLQTFDRLENAHSIGRPFSVHPRTATRYSIKYKAPLPTCVFTLQAKTRVQGKNKTATWLLCESKTSTSGSTRPEGLTPAFKEFWRSNTKDWRGLGSGLVASPPGIAAALEKVDEIVRRFQSVEAVPSKTTEQPSAAPAQNEAKASGQAQSRQPKPAKADTPANGEQDVIMID